MHTAETPPVTGKCVQLEKILLGRLAIRDAKVDDTFSSANEIAEEFGVAIGTARRALQRLTDRGYLASKRGVGYVVVSKPAADPLDAAPGNPRVGSMTKTLLFVVRADTATDRATRVADMYQQGVCQACDEQDIDVALVRNTRPSLERAMASVRPVGVVAYGLREALAIDTGDLPVVNIGETAVAKRQISLEADAEAGAQAAFRYLCGLGHQKMAMLVVGPDDRYGSGREMLVLGMRAAFARYGVAWSRHAVWQHGIDDPVPDDLLPRLMEQGYTAAFCQRCQDAIGIYRQAHKQGIRIGEDFSVVGFGNHDWMDFLAPALCRVKWDAARYGRMAFEAIRASQPVEENARTLGPVELVRGESVARLV